MGTHIRNDRDSSRGRAVRRLARTLTGLVVGASLFATGGIALAGEGGAGSDGGGNGNGGNGRIVWTYKDSYGTPNMDNLKLAMLDTSNGKDVAVHPVDSPSQPASSTMQSALNQAIVECQQRYASHHEGSIEGSNCRLVSAGMVETDGLYTGNTGGFSQQQWLNAWEQSGISDKTYSHNDIDYSTDDTFDDGVTSIESLVERESVGSPAIIVVVLSDDEPPIPKKKPGKPSKKISSGVSADSMTNKTTISSKTGIGGSAMVFTDRIDPHGVTYSISNQKMMDGSNDISSQFSFSKSGDVLSATWKGGDLPDNHTFSWSFDVTVSQPGNNTVKDEASVKWGDEPAADTDEKEFPTWSPKPDKAWIRLDAKGDYVAVIDPSWTNQVGIDGSTVLDGDHIASAVNAPVSSNLAQAPTTFSIIDDFAAADYLVDLGDLKTAKVFMSDAEQGGKSSVADIVNKGKDVTGHFTVKASGTRVTAQADSSFKTSLKGRAKAAQVSLVVPFTVNYANGGGAAKVRQDYHKKAGEELAFCTAPGADGNSGAKLTNSGAEIINEDNEKTNEPGLCGYLPPVSKDVLGESSQGGDQSSIDGKEVMPGQKVEYQLETSPKLPENLAYDLSEVSLTDRYSPYITVDKQTLEITDLASGSVLPKSHYSTSWDDPGHQLVVDFKPDYVAQAWKADSNPRLLLRFEARVNLDAPVHQTIDNQWVLELNNSLTPSNTVSNTPPDPQPGKEDTQEDGSISIDGKTAFLGDVLWYRIKLDAASLTNTAYKISRLGIVDDYDEQYLKALTDKIAVLDEAGKNVTDKFNIQVKDGVFYAFFKTVDTLIPATGQVVPGEPQPSDLKAYSEKELNQKVLNPQTGEYETVYDPAIDQSVLGQNYQVILPAEVIKVSDGYTVKNQATQVTDNVRTVTNQVTNQLPAIDPRKDVLINIGEGSRDKGEIPLGDSFLYQLDSSALPADRAYPAISQWSIRDDYDQAHDHYAGHWAVYAKEDVIASKSIDLTDDNDGNDSSASGGATSDSQQHTGPAKADSSAEAAGNEPAENGPQGPVLYRKGEKIIVDGIQQPTDPERAAGRSVSALPAFFTFTEQDGVFTAQASATYLDLVSANNSSPQQWSLFVQFVRIATGSVENNFNETVNRADRRSNTVLTRTPDEKPSIKLEKYDVASGLRKGDRNDMAHALSVKPGSDTRIGFLLTNTGNLTLHKLKLSDKTIKGSGQLHDIEYPTGWDSLELKPGQSVTLYGTLSGVKTADTHTDDATVHATAERHCPLVDPDPFDDAIPSADPRKSCDGQQLSAHDPWNAKTPPQPAVPPQPATPPLARTGSDLGGLGWLVLLLGGAGLVLLVTRRRPGRGPEGTVAKRPSTGPAPRSDASHRPPNGRRAVGRAHRTARLRPRRAAQHALVG